MLAALLDHQERAIRRAQGQGRHLDPFNPIGKQRAQVRRGAEAIQLRIPARDFHRSLGMWRKGLQVVVAEFVPALGANLDNALFGVAGHADLEDPRNGVTFKTAVAKRQLAFGAVLDVNRGLGQFGLAAGRRVRADRAIPIGFALPMGR